MVQLCNSGLKIGLWVLLSIVLISIVIVIIVVSVGSADSENKDVLENPLTPNSTATTTTDDPYSPTTSLTATAASEAGLDSVFFLLYSADIGNFSEEILQVGNVSSVESSSFIPGKKTVVLVHGFRLTGFHGSMHKIAEDVSNAALESQPVEEINIISVDWGVLAAGTFFEYMIPVENSRPVANRIKEFIDFLMDNFGGSLEDFYPIGFSLGSHVVGHLGHYFQGNMERVTGLDPPELGFEDNALNRRLSNLSANFVDVIHTTIGVPGTILPMGHADFYPNGGNGSQPGCETENPHVKACSHIRATHIFGRTAMYPSDEYEATRCPSWDEFESGSCDGNDVAMMGWESTDTARGKYFLQLERTSYETESMEGN